jgi:hypothetical protein
VPEAVCVKNILTLAFPLRIVSGASRTVRCIKDRHANLRVGLAAPSGTSAFVQHAATTPSNHNFHAVWSAFAAHVNLRGTTSSLRLKNRAAFAAHHHFTLATTTQIHLEKPLSKVVHFDSTLSGAL